jgi:hypothetical protein
MPNEPERGKPFKRRPGEGRPDTGPPSERRQTGESVGTGTLHKPTEAGERRPIAESHGTVQLKQPNPNKGFASLVFHYMGDSKFTLFFQETMKLKKAMEGYDKVVLLKFDEEKQSWLDWSEKDEEIADVIATPTTANVAKYLKQLADEGYTIDVWIIGHGSTGSFNISKGSYGEDENMTDDEIAKLAANAGYSELPIRMVWSTLCYGETLNDAWLSAGANAVGGSRYVYFYPITFGGFASAWNKGDVSYSSALDVADTSTVRTLVQAALEVHAKGCLKQWGGKIWDLNILGNGKAAEKYFTGMWLSEKEWQDDRSGKENMNYSSEKFIVGDGKHITKKSTWSTKESGRGDVGDNVEQDLDKIEDKLDKLKEHYDEYGPH